MIVTLERVTRALREHPRAPFPHPADIALERSPLGRYKKTIKELEQIPGQLRSGDPPKIRTKASRGRFGAFATAPLSKPHSVRTFIILQLSLGSLRATWKKKFRGGRKSSGAQVSDCIFYFTSTLKWLNFCINIFFLHRREMPWFVGKLINESDSYEEVAIFLLSKIYPSRHDRSDKNRTRAIGYRMRWR